MKYEICDSTESSLPFSLLSVLKSWHDNEDQDEDYLFLSVVYVMMLECGFCPYVDDGHIIEGLDWRVQELKLTNISYDVRRVRHYTENFVPFKDPAGGSFLWRFRIADFPYVLMIVDMVDSSPTQKLINLNVIAKNTNLGSGIARCYNLRRFVPFPKAPTPAGKFANLRELSIDFKTLASHVRGEVFFLKGLADKTAFEFLPPHIHEEIAEYVPDYNLHNPPSAPEEKTRYITARLMR